MAQSSGTEPMTTETNVLGHSTRQSTRAAADVGLATTPVADSYTWSDIRDTLLKWLGDPLMLEDDGIDAPTRDLIKSAIDFAQDYGGVAPPTSVGPTPEGGISFEWRRASDIQIVEIVSVGKAERTVISGGTVLLSEVLERTPPSRWEQVER